MAEVASAFVSLIPSAKGFGSATEKQIGGEMNSSGKSIGSKFGTAMKVGAAATVGGALVVGKFLGDAIGEAREAEKIGARTENVIKRMGNASNISAKQVGNLATNISLKTGIDDEAIQSGENLLLTFGNIRNEAGKGNDIFNQTTGLMTDMSAALGTDAKGSAIQLGKALNDPVKGLTALSRVGVSFTKQQENQIKKMAESGDTLGAQKVILGELKKQFGGAAEAMATPGDKVKVAWGNVKEQIGTQLLPIVDKFLNMVLDAMPTVMKVIEGIGPAFGKVKDFIKPVVDFVKNLFDSFGGGGGRLGQMQSTFKSVFDSIKSIVKSAVDIVKALWKAFGGTLIRFAKVAFDAVLGVIRGAFKIISGIFKVVSSLLKGDWKGVWSGIKQIVSGAWDVIKNVVKLGWAAIKGIFSVAGTIIKGVFGRIWDGIKTLAGNAWDGIKGVVSDGADSVVDFIRGLPGRIMALAGRFGDAGRDIIGRFVDGLQNAGGVISGIAGNVWDALRGMLNSAINQINSALSFTINTPGPDIHIDPPNIPTLASGGIATRGTLAVVGEGRESEAIMPLSKLSAMLDRERAASSGARRGGNVFHLYDADGTLMGTMRGVVKGDRDNTAMRRRAGAAG